MLFAEERANLELACNTLLELSIAIAPPMNQLKALVYLNVFINHSLGARWCE